MIATHATAADFTRWEEQARAMSTAALLYTVRDCQNAARAMRGHNPVREGFYVDQACTFGDELRRRQG
jgi:hypothetical protein